MRDDVVWVGRKSKRSPVKGSGGHTAEAHGATLHIQQYFGSVHFTVTFVRVGEAPTIDAAKAAAIAMARRLEAAAGKEGQDGEEGAG
jgi:hypothetical protein